MKVESEPGNKANRFFNRVADGAASFTKEIIGHYNNYRTESVGAALHREELGYALMVFIPAAKTVQALASLSASITGGRKRAPRVESSRINIHS